ncbi:MAG: SH3 domain-containing protein, partial [Proteobacteria bacterium]|nr:SH3 domain-containing protein [Pseudomonadota bacterium]
MNSIKLGTVLFALLAMPAFAAETGSVIRVDGIKAEPFRDAKTIATLSVGDKVEIVKKNGGWLQIKSPKGKGWVHMLNVR